MVRQGCDEFESREDRPREVRAVWRARRASGWAGNGGRALYQGGVEIQFHHVATRRLDAGIGDQADQDHPGNAVLPELDVEVGVREAVLVPMFLSDDTAQLR